MEFEHLVLRTLWLLLWRHNTEVRTRAWRHDAIDYILLITFLPKKRGTWSDIEIRKRVEHEDFQL